MGIEGVSSVLDVRIDNDCKMRNELLAGVF